MSNDISVTIYGLDSILYQGSVIGITSVNDKGKFDILPLHSNFISIVSDFLILHENNGEQKEFKLNKGVLKFTNNEANIFLGLDQLKR